MPLILYCLVELLLDYILKLEFRTTGLIWLYIPIFYLGLWGMIGYAFLISRIYGFITLAICFISLLVTWLGIHGKFCMNKKLFCKKVAFRKLPSHGLMDLSSFG